MTRCTRARIISQLQGKREGQLVPRETLRVVNTFSLGYPNSDVFFLVSPRPTSTSTSTYGYGEYLGSIPHVMPNLRATGSPVQAHRATDSTPPSTCSGDARSSRQWSRSFLFSSQPHIKSGKRLPPVSMAFMHLSRVNISMMNT